MTRIEGRLGSDDATKSYLAINRQLTRQLTNATSGTAIDRFFATASERADTRKLLREEVYASNKRLPNDFKIRFEPVIAYVEEKFDSWIDQARKRGVGIEAKQKEIAASVIGTLAGTTSIGINLWGPDAIRFARFQNGAEVGIKVNPAVIEDGAIGETGWN
ncbi:MAG: hypothetical protein WCE51_08095 [Chthoniobacterales bacterium]